MQAALASLAVGEWREAYSYAKKSHLKMPQYRPALRYLIALAGLLDQPVESKSFEKKLRKLEPGFVAYQLTNPGYPVHTLRALGLVNLAC